MVDGAAGSGEFAASEFPASLARSALLSLTSQIPRFSEFFSPAIPTYPSFSSRPSHHRHVPTPKDVCVKSAFNFELESLSLIGFDPEFKIGICESEPYATIFGPTRNGKPDWCCLSWQNIAKQ